MEQKRNTQECSHQARALILAAGQGKRLRSETCDLPKVMRQAQGKPLLAYVLEALNFLPDRALCLVLGYKWEKVRPLLPEGAQFVLQEEQLGTGHAVACARSWLEAAEGPVLICYGDMPLIRRSTYEGLLHEHNLKQNACTVLAYSTDLDLAYGRIFRDAEGNFDCVIEDRDCTEEQKRNHEYNAGVYVFEPKALLEGLSKLQNHNAQREYYLTDVPGFLRAEGLPVGVYASQGRHECMGVNTEEDLQQVSQWLQEENYD